MKQTLIKYLFSIFQNYDASKEEDVQKIRSYLERLGLEGKNHEQRIELLSGGQKSRLVYCFLNYV
jgi:ATPase subunit of ABC transporter with duplicated ATPase domains